MIGTAKIQRDRYGGFTLLEIMVATALWVVSMLALTGIVVPLTRQREQVESKFLVLAQARSVLEEVKAAPGDSVFLLFDGKTYTVDGVTGAHQDGSAVSVTVDKTNPKLVVVTVTGNWQVGNHTEDLELRTEIYSPTGQT